MPARLARSVAAAISRTTHASLQKAINPTHSLASGHRRSISHADAAKRSVNILTEFPIAGEQAFDQLEVKLSLTGPTIRLVRRGCLAHQAVTLVGIGI